MLYAAPRISRVQWLSPVSSVFEAVFSFSQQGDDMSINNHDLFLAVLQLHTA